MSLTQSRERPIPFIPQLVVEGALFVGGVGLVLTFAKATPISIPGEQTLRATPQTDTVAVVSDEFLIQQSVEALTHLYSPASKFVAYQTCTAAVDAIPRDLPKVVFVTVNPEAWRSTSRVINDKTCATKVKQTLATYIPGARMCLYTNDMIPGDTPDRANPFEVPHSVVDHMQEQGYGSNIYSCAMPQNSGTAWAIVLKQQLQP